MGQVGGGSIRWNPYIYAGANPLNYLDPSGRFFWPILAGAIGGALVSLIQQVTALRESGVFDLDCIIQELDWKQLVKDIQTGVYIGATISLAMLSGGASLYGAVAVAGAYVLGTVFTNIYLHKEGEEIFDGINLRGIASNAFWGSVFQLHGNWVMGVSDFVFEDYLFQLAFAGNGIPWAQMILDKGIYAELPTETEVVAASVSAVINPTTTIIGGNPIVNVAIVAFANGANSVLSESMVQSENYAKRSDEHDRMQRLQNPSNKLNSLTDLYYVR